jgi:TolB-like protein
MPQGRHKPKLPVAYRGNDTYAFACYDHADARLVYSEIADLGQRGYRVYYDEGIGAGRDWHDDLADAIDRCSLFIMFVTRHSVVNPNCLRELTYAHETKKPVLAVHLEQVELPRGIKLALGDRQAVFRAGDDERYRTQLTRALEEFLGPSAVTQGTTAAQPPMPARTKTSRRALVWAGGIATLLVLAVLGAWSFRERAVSAGSELPPIRSLAVLPLENLSGDPEQGYFADAMTETLIAELAKLTEVRVISRTSVMQYKGNHRPVREIASELDVDGVIEGSVLRADEKVRITAQLIDARSDRHLWAERYDRELAHVLDIQSEVAHAVADAIQLALSPQQMARFAPKKPIDPRAQEAYFRGIAARDHMVIEAIPELVEAIRIAPDFAPARAAHAALLYELTTFAGLPGYESDVEMLDSAKGEALRAVQLDDSLGDAHMALGVAHFLRDWDWQAAERELRRGRELGSSDPTLLAWAPGFFLITGRRSEALSWLEETVAAAPNDRFVRAKHAELLRDMGRPEEALEEAGRILAVNPHDNFGLIQRVYALEALGRVDDVRQHYATLIARTDVDYSWLRPMEACDRNLQADGVAGYWRCYARNNLTDVGFIPIHAAKLYIRAGDTDEAFVALEQAYRMRQAAVLWVPQSAEFAPLRDDPRFTNLASRLKLPVPAKT